MAKVLIRCFSYGLRLKTISCELWSQVVTSWTYRGFRKSNCLIICLDAMWDHGFHHSLTLASLRVINGMCHHVNLSGKVTCRIVLGGESMWEDGMRWVHQQTLLVHYQWIKLLTIHL